MRVILASTGMVDIPPARGGGVEAYVWDLAQILVGRGCPVEVVSNLRDGQEATKGVRMVTSGSIVDRFPLRPFPSSIAHLLGGSFTARAAHHRIPNGGTPAVVHLNEEVSSILISRAFPQLPKVFTLHNPPPVGPDGAYGLLETGIRWANSAVARRFIWNRMDVVIALASWIREYLVANGVPPDRVVTLPAPIRTDLFRPEPRTSSDLAYVLAVGRLDRRKNVLGLLEAMRHVAPPTQLVLVGQGPLRARILELVHRWGLEKRVRMYPSFSLDGLIRCYQGALALCHPSGLEAFPRVVLEAAACGVPCVLPDSFLYRDFIERGFVQTYEYGSSEGLAGAIGELARDGELRRRMADRARSYSETHASYSAFGDRLLALYQRALALHAA